METKPTPKCYDCGKACELISIASPTPGNPMQSVAVCPVCLEKRKAIAP